MRTRPLMSMTARPSIHSKAKSSFLLLASSKFSCLQQQHAHATALAILAHSVDDVVPRVSFSNHTFCEPFTSSEGEERRSFRF
ncbi:hypothetical protein BU26DRAFT_230933 [Trematosphaeria pertusa]|uniref:Uncharacterized protein n=1 Tax=Trematosphaeria pertusa TaxID=390896 RepID=A0A6A6IXF6_9PLEO|nr:uncharacterized protein BU26DRAFT_230933 [Trematosphaeria pertusa]KAF2253873.1 hypothetical protein BU26DRAFT_230933 [Trematosphaeria pertusa]